MSDNKLSLKAGRCHAEGCFNRLNPEPIIIEINGIRIWTLLCTEHKNKVKE